MTPDTRTTENPEPRTEAGRRLRDRFNDPLTRPTHAISVVPDILAIEAEAAQGAAPRAEGHEHSFVLQQGATCRCGAAAPRAEGLPDRSAIRQGIDQWYAEDHPGIDEDEWRDGLLGSILARLSERRDKEGTE